MVEQVVVPVTMGVGEAVAEAGCVLLRDGEDAVAALGAAGAADEVRAATLRGGGEGGGYDLDEVGHWVVQSEVAMCALPTMHEWSTRIEFPPLRCGMTNQSA